MSDDLRVRIAAVLMAHQRHVVHDTGQFCLCGWGELGRSHPDHVAGALMAELTLLAEERRLHDGEGGIQTNYNTGEIISYSKAATRQVRYVTPWVNQ